MLNIVKREQRLLVETLRIVLYGDPGSFKTSLAFTATNPILFDFDKGAHRAHGRGDTNVIGDYAEVAEIIAKDELRACTYRTAIIDTGASCIDNFIANFVMKADAKNRKGDGSLSLSGYGAAKTVFNLFLNYLGTLGMDIIIICHGTEKEKGGDRMVVRPKMTGGSYDIMMQAADLVGYVRQVNNQATLDFNPTDEYVGKNSAEFKPMILPHYSDAAWSNYMATLIQTAKDKLNTVSAEQQQALERIDKYTKDIAAAADPATFQKISDELAKEVEYIRVAIKTVMGNRMKEMGMKYTKELGFHKPEPVPDVFGVNTEYQIIEAVGSLENVMKPSDCLYIAKTRKEAEDWIVANKVQEPVTAVTDLVNPNVSADGMEKKTEAVKDKKPGK